MSSQAKGQRKTQDPCAKCFLHKMRCLCDQIPNLQLKTKLTLVIHYKELRRTTNTGVLAAHALKNSQILVRGKKDQHLDLREVLDPQYQAVLFYPCEEAVDLSADFVRACSRPIQLIVPDGSWRQASKVHSRHKEISDLPRVMIKQPNLEKSFLRKESTLEGMATLQALAYAFGVIEGVEVQEKLLSLYRLKLERTLSGRGFAIF